MWWSQHYVIIRKPVSELNVFCNLVNFSKICKPASEMHGQYEVIVRMPPVMRIAKREIVWFDLRTELDNNQI